MASHTPALRALTDALAAGRLSRRAFVQRATALGLSASLAGLLARDPAIARAAAQETPPAANGERTGPAAEKLIFSSVNVDQAPLVVSNNDLDLYLFGLKAAGVQDLEADPGGVRLIRAPASTISLILNPAPAREGELNPFADKDIRWAMQFLVDRDFIANDIYQRRAVPMLSHVSPLDYDQLTVFEAVRGTGLRFDPEGARTLIASKMEAAGAALEDNVWTFNGQDVVLKIVTRVEDERREIGDLVARALESVGFTVQSIYQPFGPATLAVYASDPQTFQWHIYTEGWGRSAPNRYDDGAINSFAAPWQGNMPGWLETGFWQYEHEELDTLGQQIFRGEFNSKDERDELYRTMTRIALGEAVRVWLVTALQSFPVREELQNVNVDLVGGPKSVFTLREAFVEGSEEVRVGHLWVWTDRTTWNPVGGFGDVYSSDIFRNIVDPTLVNHPHTGLPQPFRADFEPETAGPDGTLDVPEDAVLWDTAADTWNPVGAGVTAISKVTFDYAKFFQAPFHHGPQITPADLMYGIAQSFELAFDEQKLQIETALGIPQRPYLETFKGFKLLEDDRLEVYVDYWHFEPSYIASYAAIGGVGTPWELLAAMDDIVFQQRQGAYTDTAAARFSVPWLSLVTETDARLVDRTLQRFAEESFVPAGYFAVGDRSLVTPEQAQERYQAAQAWFEERNLLILSNGPFFLAAYQPSAQFAELQAFRPETYPFSPGQFLFGDPPTLTVEPPPAPPAVPLGEAIEVPITVQGPGALALRYILIDPAAGSVLASGEAQGQDGAFSVTIDPSVTSTLFPGVYQLYLLASSDAVSQVSEQRVDVEISV